MKNAQQKAHNSDVATIWQAACDAGLYAGNAETPIGMHVVERANPLNDNSPVVRDYGVISDGVCGFATVIIKPARGKLVAFLKANKIGYKSYYGGWEVSIHAHNQSMQRKEANARAMCEVLCANGIDCYTTSRMD